MQFSVAAGPLALPIIWLTVALGGHTLMFKGLARATASATTRLTEGGSYCDLG